MFFVARFRAVLIATLSLLLPAIASAFSSFGAGSTGGPTGGSDLQLAYIDPGAGSFVVQALVAMIAGIAVTGRLYWTKIKSILGIATADDDDDSIDDD